MRLPRGLQVLDRLRRHRPATVFAVNDLVAVESVWLLRWWQFGEGYNYALSSTIGDRLIAAYLAYVSKRLRDGSLHDFILEDGQWDFECVAVAASAATILTAIGHGTVADTYHNSVVVFLLGNQSLRVTRAAFRSGDRQLIALWFAVYGAWLGLSAVDWVTGRIDQPTWHREHGN